MEYIFVFSIGATSVMYNLINKAVVSMNLKVTAVCDHELCITWLSCWFNDFEAHLNQGCQSMQKSNFWFGSLTKSTGICHRAEDRSYSQSDQGTTLPQLLQNYNPPDIVVAGENKLFCKLVPNRLLVFNGDSYHSLASIIEFNLKKQCLNNFVCKIIKKPILLK